MDRTKEIPSVTKPETLYNNYAETSVIGSMIFDPETDDAIYAIEQLKPKDFYLRQHRDIWAQIVMLSSTGQTVDMATVENALKQQNSEVTFGQLGEMVKNAPPELTKGSSYSSETITRCNSFSPS